MVIFFFHNFKMTLPPIKFMIDEFVIDFQENTLFNAASIKNTKNTPSNAGVFHGLPESKNASSIRVLNGYVEKN